MVQHIILDMFFKKFQYSLNHSDDIAEDLVAELEFT